MVGVFVLMGCLSSMVLADTIERTVADGGDWTSLQASSPAVAMNPNERNLDLRSRDVAGTPRHTVVALRFFIGDLPGEITAAEMQLFARAEPEETESFNLVVYGLVEGSASETTTDREWTHLPGKHGVSYNAMPGLVAVDEPLRGIDVEHVKDQTIELGVIPYQGVQPEILTMESTQALVDFLKADTDGYVTFLIECEMAAPGQDLNIYLRSGAGLLGNAEIYPTLKITTAPK